MNVLAVGLLCIAVYVVLMVVWIRYDANKNDYASAANGGEDR